MRELPHYILDANGQPERVYSLQEWAQWYEASCTNGQRMVARTEIGGQSVSTIFLAFDHSRSGTSAAPVLWETMIFGSWPLRHYQRRYTSRRGAIIGHYWAVLRAWFSLLTHGLYPAPPETHNVDTSNSEATEGLKLLQENTSGTSKGERV